MAKKKSKDRLGRIGRVEREQRLTKIIQYSMIGILVVVAAVVIGGLVISAYVTPNVVIATVYDEEITVGEFQTQVRFQRAQMIDTMNQYAQLYQVYTDPSFQQQISSYIQQVQVQLEDPQALGQAIINQMIDDVLVKREAESRGITVTEDEVLAEVGSSFGYYPDGYPTFTPAPTAEPVEDGEDTDVAATPMPEPTSVTEAEFEQSVSDYLDAFDQYGVTREALFDLIEAQLYREKLSDELAEGIDNMEDQVWARHILVEDEETAESVLERLEAGESFEDLAAELSIDTSNAQEGGDLGWFREGMMVGPFNDAAFGAEVGEVVGPVETQFGYHIIEVLGHEMRPMAEADFNNLVNLALIDLLSEIKGPAEEAGDIVLNPEWTKYTPDDPRSPFSGQIVQ